MPLAFELFSLSWLYLALAGAEKEIEKEFLAKNVQRSMSHITHLMLAASTSLIYYKSTKSEEFSRRYEECLKKLHAEFGNLEKMLGKSEKEMRSLSEVKVVVERAEMYMEEVRRALDTGDEERQLEFLRGWKAHLSQLSEALDKITIHYRELAETAPEKERLRREILKQLVLVSIATSMVLAAALALYFNKDTSARLRVLMENTRLFEKGESLPPPLSGRDEIAELDSKFHEMAEKIKLQDRQKQEFVAMITHDMRSPISAVLNSLDLLVEGILGEPLPERSMGAVKRSQQSLGRVVKLINDLLDAEKLAAGKMDMHFSNQSLPDLIEQAVQTVKPLAAAKHLQVSVQCQPAEIFADGDRLVQVLINLFSNAIKFSPEDSALNIEACSLPENWFELRVKDQGPGIAVEEQKSIFNRFEQSKSKRAKGGTGLGLAICKDIVEAHCGLIGVSSSEGEGSCFWFRLPCTQEAMLSASAAQR